MAKTIELEGNQVAILLTSCGDHFHCSYVPPDTFTIDEDEVSELAEAAFGVIEVGKRFQDVLWAFAPYTADEAEPYETDNKPTLTVIPGGKGANDE